MQRDLLTERPFKNRMGLRAPEIPSIKGVIHEVCDRHGISYPEMVGPRRQGFIVAARQEAMWECAKRTGASLPQIGFALGKRHHTTIIHGIRKHQERMGQAVG